MGLHLIDSGNPQPRIEVMLRSNTTGQGATNMLAAGVSACTWQVDGQTTITDITLADAAYPPAYAAGKWSAVDPTRKAGAYLLDLPTALVAAGNKGKVVTLRLSGSGFLDAKETILVGPLSAKAVEMIAGLIDPTVAPNLDAPISSRAPASTAVSNANLTAARINKLDNLDGTITSRAPAATALSNADLTAARITKLDNLDTTVSSRVSTADLTLARIQKLDNLDGTITSRAAAATAISNAELTAARIARLVAKRAMGVMGAALIPTLGGLVQRMITAGAVVVNWIKANQALVVTVFKIAAAVTGAGLALVVLGKGLTLIAAVVKGASVACSVLVATIGAIGSVLGFVLTPLGGVIVLLGGLAAYLVYASGAGAKLLTWLGEKFSELRETALLAFKGISDAMAAGNMALAAKILWLGLKIAWQNGTAELQKGWLSFAGWFQKIAYGAFYGVQAAAELVTHGITVAWIEGVAFMKSAWVSLSSLVASANEAMVNGFVKAWIWAKSKTDSSFDAAFASDYANKQHTGEQARIEQERRAALSRIESERAANSQYAQKQHEARLSEVGQAYNDAASAVEAEKAAKVQQAASELNQAKADLQAAIDQAARARQTSGPGKPMPLLGAAPGMGGEDFASLSDLLANSAKRTIGVAGTFNAAEARGLGSGSVVDRIANATDATARNTRKLLDKLRGQAVFE